MAGVAGTAAAPRDGFRCRGCIRCGQSHPLPRGRRGGATAPADTLRGGRVGGKSGLAIGYNNRSSAPTAPACDQWTCPPK